MKRFVVVMLAAALLVPVANADQGKGQGKGQDKGGGQWQSGGPAQDSHGQAVSDCNHRANERQLKGQERHDFVEWCTDRSERHGFDDRRWNDDRGCYEGADRKGLSGDARRNFVRNCIEERSRDRDRDRESQGTAKGKGENGKDKEKGGDKDKGRD